mmetsp:Transcript_22571/g.51211  ORF Transcript_22571/g.51211 Transcript_22571/m.51211 type:complete len:389 (+) Transcript_22571:884-2050(+)
MGGRRRERGDGGEEVEPLRGDAARRTEEEEEGTGGHGGVGRPLLRPDVDVRVPRSLDVRRGVRRAGPVRDRTGPGAVRRASEGGQAEVRIGDFDEQRRVRPPSPRVADGERGERGRRVGFQQQLHRDVGRGRLGLRRGFPRRRGAVSAAEADGQAKAAARGGGRQRLRPEPGGRRRGGQRWGRRPRTARGRLGREAGGAVRPGRVLAGPGDAAVRPRGDRGACPRRRPRGQAGRRRGHVPDGTPGVRVRGQGELASVRRDTSRGQDRGRGRGGRPDDERGERLEVAREEEQEREEEDHGAQGEGRAVRFVRRRVGSGRPALQSRGPARIRRGVRRRPARGPTPRHPRPRGQARGRPRDARRADRGGTAGRGTGSVVRLHDTGGLAPPR